VYIRDGVSDPGLTARGHPWMSPNSPDIIISRTSIANPQSDFGDASPGANSLDASQYDIQTNDWLYVRVKNKGVTSSPPITISLYWSFSPNWFTPPLQINPLQDLSGQNITFNIPSVPGGNKLTVSSGTQFLKPTARSNGSVALIAVVDCPTNPIDRAPLIPTNIRNHMDFTNWARGSNNVAFRRFYLR
jgi:hypothetical protein